MKEYIMMNKVAILRSVKKAGEAAKHNTQTIYRWFQPVQRTLDRLAAQWTPDQLRHNADSKKERNRKGRTLPSNQPRLTGYCPFHRHSVQTLKYTACHAPLARSAAAPRSTLD